MMHLDRDPLDESSVSRFRLVLREADDKFFRDNVMSSFLPQPFFFDGVSSQKGVVAEAGPGQGPLSPTPPTDQAASSPLPVECEAHWRLYRNATFLKAHLRRLVAEQNVNLSDFMFHCLRSCYLVVMTARDEASSFSIFSTLNSRGVDLTEVDKLKADLFKGQSKVNPCTDSLTLYSSAIQSPRGQREDPSLPVVGRDGELARKVSVPRDLSLHEGPGDGPGAPGVQPVRPGVL